MVHHPEPKKAVALIRNAFANKGVTVQTKEAYNLLAQLWGYNDWATYRGLNPKDVQPVEVFTPEVAAVPFGRERSELEGWQTWVVLNRMNDDGDEDLFILPFGATLEARLNHRHRWPYLDDEGAVPLTVGFTDPSEHREGWQDLVVAVAVASEFPRAENYGYPMHANEREVGKWLEETLGWGYLSSHNRPAVDVYPHDRGDDGTENWWVEVLVHPSVHARLLTQFA